MLSSAWLLGFLPSALLLSSLALAGVWLSWRWSAVEKLSSSGSGAFSRHPSPPFVYSDLPFRDPLPAVLLSFAAHWLLFYLAPLPAAWAAPKPAGAAGPSSRGPGSVVQRSYVVSTVHAVCAVSCVLGWLCVYPVDVWSLQRGLGGGRRGTGDEWQSLAVSWSLGYFAYDSACMALYAATWSDAALLHHAAIGSAFLLGLYTDCSRPFHFAYLLEELSTPPLNLKSLLARSRPAVADRCAAAFALTFFVARLGYGSAVFCVACLQLGPFVRRAAQDGERVQAAAALFQFAMCAASRLLNLYWAALIARKLRRAMRDEAGGRKQRLQPEAHMEGNAVTGAAGGTDKVD